MATCFENLVKHFEFVTRQSEHCQLGSCQLETNILLEEEEKIWQLLTAAEDLCFE